MDKIVRQFVAVIEEPFPNRVKRLKEDTNKKIIGVAPMWCPEEIIHAAGAIPILTIGNHNLITLARSYVQAWMCSAVNELVEMAMKAELDHLDGLVIPHTCQQMGGVFDIVRRRKPKINWLVHLHLTEVLRSPRAKDRVREDLKIFKESLELFVGHEISDVSLRESIHTYNRSRTLIKRLYQLRRNNPGLLSTWEMTAVVVSSMLMPKEDHNQLLEQLLQKIQMINLKSENKVKVVLSGLLCESPPKYLLDLIENAGAIVVDDDLYSGSRYSSTNVPEDGPPLECLTHAYLNTIVPCPTRFQPDLHWGDYLLNMVKESDAQGVISLIVKYCEPHYFYYPSIKEKLQKAGVAELSLEIEPEAKDSGQIRTRVEAFVEMVDAKGNKHTSN